MQEAGECLCNREVFASWDLQGVAQRGGFQSLLEAGGRQDVHVSVFELVRSGSLPPAVHRRDLHLGRRHLLGGGVVGQPGGLSLHHLHRRRLLGAAVRLQSKACWEKRTGSSQWWGFKQGSKGEVSA